MVDHDLTTLDAFKDYFEGLVVDCDKGRCSSVPLQALQQWMTIGRIKKLLEQHDVKDADERLCAAILMNYRVVFIILILIGKGREISSIVQLVQFIDDKLPFKLFSSENWPLGDPCFLEFYKKQWFFAGLRWEQITLESRRFEDSSVLPIKSVVGEQHGSNSIMQYVDLLPKYNGLNTSVSTRQILCHRPLPIRTDTNNLVKLVCSQNI